MVTKIVETRIPKLSMGELQHELDQFTGTEKYHRLGMGVLNATDGIAYLCEKAKCYWLFTDIEAYYATHRVPMDGILFWELVVKFNPKSSITKPMAVLTCVRDKGETPLVVQNYSWVDLPDGKLMLYVADGVMLLPSEY